MTPGERTTLVNALSRDERAALRAEIDAADVRDAVAEALQHIALGRSEPSTAPDLPAVMNPEAAAAYAGIGINRMRDLLKTDAIPHRRDGRRYLVRREALDQWMRAEEDAERRRGLRIVGA